MTETTTTTTTGGGAPHDPLRGLQGLAEHQMSRHLAEEVLKDRWVFCTELGWMEWDGIKWVRHPDREGIAVKTYMRAYLEKWLKDEVLNFLPAQATAMMGYVKASGLKRLEDAVKTVGGTTVPHGRFDADPHLLNTPSGVLDLLGGTLRPHDPRLYLTRVTGASYRPGARHADWDKALEALPDDETAEWYGCYLARGLLGDQGGLEFVAFLLGEGANGKSLTLGAVLKALGDYADVVESDILAQRVHDEYVAALRGLRLAVVEELSDGHRLNVARIKKMVGTVKMGGRHLFRPAMTWEPIHTLVVTSNYMPLVPETDHGAWRRLVAVPFPKEFQSDDALKQRVHGGIEQQEAVLAWLVERVARPVPPPTEAMVEATDGWRAAVDLIAQFLDECCVRDATGAVRKTDLLEAFNEFAARQGNRPLSARMFSERFRKHKTVKEWEVEDKAVWLSGATAKAWAGLSLKAPSIRSRHS